MTLVDANVLLDVVSDDPVWVAWSLARLAEAALTGSILINDVVYAEISVRFSTIEELDETLADAAIGIVPIPRSALFPPARPSCATERPAAPGPAYSPISSLALMQPSKAGRC